MPAAETKEEPAPSGGRFSPRNWRVTTRLNAILLIPVLVGLVMGGFQVKSSIDTWQDAEDAESTARLVQASLNYANALYNERDTTAAPLLQGKGEQDTAVVQARQATDKAADAFDEAAQGMPSKPGLERRLKVFRDQEPKLQSLRAAAYTPSSRAWRPKRGTPASPTPHGVRQRAGSGHRQHHLLRPYRLRHLPDQRRRSRWSVPSACTCW